MDSVWYYSVVFALYSVVGWLIDSLYSRLYEGHWAKRGFHHGPFFMLYGWGVILPVIIFNEQSPLFIVVPVVLVYAALVEYVGSVFLGRIGIRAWDYTKNRFNLRGRICAQSTLLFSVGLVGVIYYVQPLVEHALNWLPHDLVVFSGLVAFMYLFVWGAARVVLQYRFYKRTKRMRNQAYDIKEQ